MVARRGAEDPLPELEIQYSDYAVWQRKWIEGEVLQRQAEYWKSTLSRAPALLELPTDHVRPAEKDYAGKKIILFSHSMFGAACCILYGKARQVENERYLAFDGKSKNGEHYIMPNATPVLLNFAMPVTPRLKAKL